ncbi:MAG: hypothetical protein ACREFR_03055 [Limisphaerales bacterium]
MASETVPRARASDWKYWVLTIIVAIIGGCLAWSQIFSHPKQSLNLPELNKLAAILRQTDDPVERDKYGVGLTAMGRELDEVLPPDARVYVANMLGPTNAPALGYYYFLRNYLFPRDVEISLGPAVFREHGAYGVGSDSPDVLRTNGFDVMIAFPNNRLEILALTPKGMPKK